MGELLGEDVVQVLSRLFLYFRKKGVKILCECVCVFMTNKGENKKVRVG